MEAAMTQRRDYLVTVCDVCMRASCWHGLFICDGGQDAGTRDIASSELRKLKAEHPSYFTKAELMRVCGHVRDLP